MQHATVMRNDTANIIIMQEAMPSTERDVLCHQGSQGIPVSLALLEVQFFPEALSLRESPLYLGVPIMVVRLGVNLSRGMSFNVHAIVPEDHPFLRDQRDM